MDSQWQGEWQEATSRWEISTKICKMKSGQRIANHCLRWSMLPEVRKAASMSCRTLVGQWRSQGRYGVESWCVIWKMRKRNSTPYTPQLASWALVPRQPLRGKQHCPFCPHMLILSVTWLNIHENNTSHVLCVWPLLVIHIVGWIEVCSS